MSTTSRTLSMKFDTDAGKKASISLSPAKSGLEAAEVAEAMDAMIVSQILTHELTAKAGATVTERTVTTLF